MWGTTLNTKIHPTQPRGGHPSHSNLVRGKLTSPTPNPAGDGTSGLTSYPRRRSKVSEATCLRPQRSAPSRTRTRAVRPRVQRSDHWATHASRKHAHANQVHRFQFMFYSLFTDSEWQSRNIEVRRKYGSKENLTTFPNVCWMYIPAELCGN